MSERRLTKSEQRLRRITTEEPEKTRRGILELFHEDEQEHADEDAPLARQHDDDTAA